jgi:hypothetical protein
MGKGVLHGLALRIEHRFLWRNNNYRFHDRTGFPTAGLTGCWRSERPMARRFLADAIQATRLASTSTVT